MKYMNLNSIIQFWNNIKKYIENLLNNYYTKTQSDNRYISKTSSIINISTNQWLSSGKYGIDLNNSDIVGVNSIFFNDASDGKDEGIFFNQSANSNTYDILRIESDHKLYILVGQEIPYTADSPIPVKYEIISTYNIPSSIQRYQYRVEYGSNENITTAQFISWLKTITLDNNKTFLSTSIPCGTIYTSTNQDKNPIITDTTIGNIDLCDALIEIFVNNSTATYYKIRITTSNNVRTNTSKNSVYLYSVNSLSKTWVKLI